MTIALTDIRVFTHWNSKLWLRILLSPLVLLLITLSVLFVFCFMSIMLVFSSVLWFGTWVLTGKSVSIWKLSLAKSGDTKE